MSKAEERALEAYPVKTEKLHYMDMIEANGGRDEFDFNRIPRAYYKEGYEQAEQDLALSLVQIVKLDNIIMNMVGEGYNDGFKTRPFYEEVLRRFNEQRNK